MLELRLRCPRCDAPEMGGVLLTPEAAPLLFPAVRAPVPTPSLACPRAADGPTDDAAAPTAGPLAVPSVKLFSL